MFIRTFSRIALAATVLITLGPVLALIDFARPLADDFSFSVAAREHGAGGAIWHQYLTWQGRWLGNGFSFVTYSFSQPKDCYGPMLYLIFAALVLVPTFLLGSLFPKVKLPTRIGLVLCLLSFYASRMRSQGEVFYWLTGAFENHLSILLLMGTFALLLRSTRWPRLYTFNLIALPILFAVTVGGHELYGVITCILLAAGTLIGFLTGSPSRKIWLICTIAAGAGVLIVVAAPGNAIRQSHFPQHTRISVDLRALLENLAALKPTLMDAGLWIGTACFVLHPQVRADRPDWALLKIRYRLTVTLLTLGICLMVALAAPSWAMGAEAPARTLDAIFLLCLFGSLIAGCVVYWSLVDPNASGLGLGTKTSPVYDAGIIVFCIFILLGANVPASINDSVRWGRRYAAAMDGRFAMLQQASDRHLRDSVVPPIGNFPGSYPAYMDIGPDPADWKNQGLAEYYRLNSVRLRESAGSK